MTPQKKSSDNLFTLIGRFINTVLKVFTIFLRYLWLIFPAFLFLLAAYFCFWTLGQGKDLLITSLEEPWRVSVMWISVVFWVFITWYSSRILVYKNDSLFNCGKDYFKTVENGQDVYDIPKQGLNLKWILYKSSTEIGLHLPRLIGYLCFSIIILAYWQLPILHKPLSAGTASLFLIAYIILYLALDPIFRGIASWIITKGSEKLLIVIYWLCLVVLLAFIFIQYFSSRNFNFSNEEYRSHAFTVIILSLILQHLFLFIIVSRRQLITDTTKPSQQKKTFIQHDMSGGEKFMRRILRFVDVPYSERKLFFVFTGISIIAIAIYLTGVFNMNFAIAVSSLSFTILAFGILVGYFGLVSIFSIHFRINFHIIFLF